MVWLPAVNEALASTAMPLLLRVTVESVVAPSLKVTEPVGTPVVPDFTVAVMVTD